MHKRLKIEIQGAVQGVGFRPFVYRLATDLALTGWVINDTQGVFIEVEGDAAHLAQFLERLPAEKPPRALIHSLSTDWLDPTGYTDFTIRHSDEHGAKTVLVLPDIATCAACLAELGDPADRRWRYPFTNCTNCGPRFTIVQALPYDRPNTTMDRFVMCPDCQAEYDNPRDRRFHAQPNACPRCGPQLEFWQAEPTAGRVPERLSSGDAALQAAVAALCAGAIVAVKGLGGFHLMVAAGHEAAVARLRERKPRRDKPFALMVRDLEQAQLLCAISPAAADLLLGPEAPIVLLPRHQPSSAEAAQAIRALVAENVAPGNPQLGLMLPYTPLHHLLLRELNLPVVATSGNLSDEPICTDEHEAVARLGHIADSFLVHNRPIARHTDDSVATFLCGEPRLLRRARGYAPLPVLLPTELPCILAVGAHLKNTIALSVGRQVFISQHIGDLESAESVAAFEQVIADFLRLYAIRPVAIAHDMHPDYYGTRWAQQQAAPPQASPGLTAEQLPLPTLLVPIQHHHAHFAACLAENGCTGPALGVIWDGTGYGRDGTIWGGEFLLGDLADSTRVAHLRPFRLPGGDAAVRQPRRSALALLWELYGPAALDHSDLAPIRGLASAERRLFTQMLERGVNAPLTSSAGRLFDGIAALIGLYPQVSFEGQAAMALEWLTDPSENGEYPIELRPNQTAGQSSILIDWCPTVAAIIADLRAGVSSGMIAARFHNTMITTIVRVARHVAVPQLALSGGCFQNRLLLERVVQRLGAAGFTVLLHRQVPPNDGGISLGQVVAAAARLFPTTNK